jgi:alkylated DNA repair dioxygenase AlkB
MTEVAGLRILNHLVDPEREKMTVRNLLANANWDSSLSRRVQEFGYEYNYKASGSLAEGARFPEWLRELCEFLVNSRECRMLTTPTQITVSEFTPGQGITAHIDNPSLFGEYVCRLVLGGSVNMVFSDSATRKIEKRVEGGTVVEMFGDTRYTWKCCVPARKSDIVSGKRVKREVAYLVTFRTINE